ncbi:putative effector protein [Ceratobasidium theobromae]|uniref:Putative effector protein n=1 Tax=Ceratobasidium theobromae TaxID=1582974 RepID=A0A5N5QF04_9AGAM|nr:putative effector protein [Ceratobasidium theobromae]
MQLINLLSLAGASFFALSGVQAARDFSASCINVEIVDNTILQGNCRKNDGSYVFAQVGLNQCLVNNNANIECQK